MKIAIYSRKSVYTGKGESIENQIQMCKQYIFANIPETAEEDINLFEDEGFSAKNMARPQFQKMLHGLRQKQYQCLVCYRLDRISRNVGDFAKLIEELENLQVSFISIKEKFDTRSVMGKGMMMMASVFAQMERETLAERVRDNMFLLARTGRWLGGTTPTGFWSEKTEKIDMDGKTKTACKLTVNESEMEAVKIMFHQFLEIQKISGVYQHLISLGITSRTGRWFSKLGIKQILQNPVYCCADIDARNYFVSQNAVVCFGEAACSDGYGLLSYNKRDYKKKNVPRLERHKWIVAIGKHEGIIAGKQWVAVQEMLEAKKMSYPLPKANNDYCILSGWIVCRQCGRKMFAKLRSGKGKGFDYICDGKIQGGTKVCACPNLNGQQTDDRVLEYLMTIVKEDPHICVLLEKIKKEIKRDVRNDPFAEMDTRMRNCQTEIHHWVNLLAQANVGQALVSQVNEKVEELSLELERLQREKKRLLEEQHTMGEKEKQIPLIAKKLSCLSNLSNEMTITEKRTLIKLSVQKIEWDGACLHIDFN